ncbi:Uncharacterised protein [Chlamydia trachomatis]|nr:Uncharacterised protein [Chlamydia trachomatis]
MVFVFGIEVELGESFFSAFEAEIRAADDEDDGQKPRGQPGEDQCDRQDDGELVNKGCARDLLDDRDFTTRVEASHILRGDGGVVDDNANGFRRCFCGARSNVIEG